MQELGCVTVGLQETIKVLIRDSKTSRFIKKRSAGKFGPHLDDEARYLKDHPEIIEKLKAGETIEL